MNNKPHGKTLKKPQSWDFDYVNCSNDTILQKLVTTETGLSEQEAKIRLEEYGLNEPAKKTRKSILLQIIYKILNPLVIVLLFIGGVSLFFGEVVNALLVAVMAILSVILSFVQEYRAGEAADKLIEMVHTTATVRRHGKAREISIKNIVPGDIVELSAGDMIPADVRILSCKDFFLNQSSLTGESFPVEKHADQNGLNGVHNIAFMGSSVVSGSAIAVVIKTGTSTEFGELAQKVSSMGVETSFDKGVWKFTMLMVKAMLCLVACIFAIVALRAGDFLEAILFSLGVAVGLTPEMLPMIVTVTLSQGAIALSKKEVIVKRLNSIQNFGAMDVLCTDKTGTLTEDRIVLEKHCDVKGRDNEDVLIFAYINSFYQTGLKNILDKAILKHEKLSIKQFEKIDEIPFDFSRKIMSVVIKKNGGHTLIAKGAPEEIFTRCSKYTLDGTLFEMTPSLLLEVEQEYYALSKEGFRVLAIAYKDIYPNNLKNREFSDTEAPRFDSEKSSPLLDIGADFLESKMGASVKEKTDSSGCLGINTSKQVYSKDDENDLILKGYVAFYDPPKQTTKKSIEALKKLGIDFKVLTGDNELVTKKICSEVGLEIHNMITGDVVEKATDQELLVLVEETNIFTRLLPMQKERIIRALHNNGHIVGYLGDGINDAPALKTSDVGISVNNAVDIAKESADLILLKKSLLVLQDAVIEGRKTFGNIIKYIKMGSSSNFGNMFSMTGASIFLPFLPMLPIQILINNLLYDLSQIAIPTDGVDDEYVNKPRAWNIDYIKKFMLVIGPISSIFDFITFGVLLYFFQATPSMFHTGWFLESLCTQILVIHVIRTGKIPFLQSKPSTFLLITTLLAVLTGIAIPLSPLAQHLGFVPMPLSYYGVLIIISVSYFSLVQVVKTLFIKKFGLV